jgi:hypothetical protein
LRKTSVSGSANVPGWESWKTLVSVTAYHSFGGEVGGFEDPHAPDSYQVTIAIPKLTDGQSCTAGRTGRVYFDGGALEVAAIAAADRL